MLNAKKSFTVMEMVKRRTLMKAKHYEKYKLSLPSLEEDRLFVRMLLPQKELKLTLEARDAGVEAVSIYVFPTNHAH